MDSNGTQDEAEAGAMEYEEEMREFLVESNENLANLDREIVELEQNPSDAELISSVFRTFHTIKGTSGFFGFNILSEITHLTENILDQIRDRQRALTPELISLVLEAVDAVKALLADIEATGREGEDRSGALKERLKQAQLITPAPALTFDEQIAAGIAEYERAQAAENSKVAPRPSQSEAASGDASVAAPAGDRTAAVADVHDKAAADASREAQIADSTIRVDVGLLNRLMNLVGELVLARNQLLQDAPAQSASMQKTSQRLNLITSELQEGLMKTRMQPVGVVWNKLPRVVRDLAAKCGKKVQIAMEGAGTELDKTIIEAIKDPLTHIVRNSCDHGIETPEVRLGKGKPPSGTLMLRAYHEGGVVNIEVSDDGAGIDPERVKAKALEKGLVRPEQSAAMSARDAMHLIFLPGFSTAEQVTSISGRGVGMDVVKTNIEKIGGSVEVMNRTEGGTTIRIKIPLTLAIIPGLVVMLDGGNGRSEGRPAWSRDERFIIPQANLVELVRLEGAEEMKRIENVHSTPVFHHRGKLLPLVYLGRVLGRSEPAESREVVNVVVLQVENRQMGLVVDRIWDTQEIVVKPLGRQLKGLSAYVGATIMGDGKPALILDAAGLSRAGGLGLQTRHATLPPSAVVAAATQPQMMLLFRAGRHERLAVPLSLVDRLEEVPTSRLERAGGQLVLHYRNEILPLMTLSDVLNPSGAQQGQRDGILQVVVFSDGRRRIGVIVDQIVDIVNDTITIKRASTVPGLLCSTVIGGKITDLIDLQALLNRAGEDWMSPATEGERKRVLLVDPSPAPREMLSEYLDVVGYDVIQAPSVANALSRAQHLRVDTVLTTVDMMDADGLELLASIRRQHSPRPVSLIGVLERAGQANFAVAKPWSFAAHVVRSDRSGLLRELNTIDTSSMDTPSRESSGEEEILYAEAA